MPPSQIIGFSPVTLGDGTGSGVRRALCPLNTLNSNKLSQESLSALLVGVPGVFDRGLVQVAENTLNGPSFLTVRRSANDTPAMIPFAAGQIGQGANAAPVLCGAADDLTWGLDTRAASDGFINPILVSQRFVPTDPMQTISWGYTGGSGGGFSADNATRFASISGTIAFQSSEAFASARVHGAFRVSGLAIEMAKDQRVSPLILRFRINGAAGNQVVTIPPGFVGRLVANAALFDQVHPGDSCNYSVESFGGGGNFNARWISTVFSSVVRQWLYACTNVNAAMIWANDGTKYVPLSGNLANATPEESLTGVPTFAQRVSKLSMYVSANNTVTPTLVTTSIEGQPGSVRRVIAPGEVGVLENLIDVDDVAEGQRVNLAIVPGGGSGRVVFRAITTLGETVA